MHGSKQQQTPCTHTSWRGQVRPRLRATEQALLLSQGGPLSGVPYSCFPTSALARFDSTQFRVLLLRRLWLPLPPSSRKCRWPSPGRPWPPPWGVGSSRFCAGVSHCQCAAWSVTWIWCLRADRTVAGSRWLLGLPFSTVHNWPLTPHWCPQWDATVCHVHAASGRMEQPSPAPDEERIGERKC